MGFLGAGVLGAGAMELVGVERLRGRDIATGIVLGFATGLAALFLYLDTTKSATTGREPADPLRIHLHAGVPRRFRWSRS